MTSRPIWRVAVLGLATILALAACSSGASPGSPSPTAASPSPSPAAASPSPAPSPSPDVVTAFLARMKDTSFSARLTIDGQLSINDVPYQIDGDGAIDDDDNRMLMRVHLPGGDQVTEQVNLEGKTYKKTRTGPWLLVDDGSGSGGESEEGLVSLLASVMSVKDEGVVTHGTRQLHRLVPSGDLVLDQAVFGFSDPTIEDFVATQEFLVDADGSLAVWTINVSWTQATGDARAAAEMTLDFGFEGLGEPVSIEVPDDVWETFTSAANGYSIAHPADWTVSTKDGVDGFQSPTDAVLSIAVHDLPKGTTVAALADQVATEDEAYIGVAPANRVPATYAGGDAVMLYYQGGAIDGTPVAAFHVLIVKGRTAHELVWISDPGDEAADAQLLDMFLATFAYED